MDSIDPILESEQENASKAFVSCESSVACEGLTCVNKTGTPTGTQSDINGECEM